MMTTRHVDMGGKEKIHEDKIKSDEYFQGGRFPLAEEKYEGEIELELPPVMQPSESTTGGSFSYFRTYDLVVKCFMDSLIHKDLEIVFPVVIEGK